MSNILLNVNGIEVIYNHVILVLKGVSLQVPEGGIVALLGGNGAGKTTTLRADLEPAGRRARRGHQGLDRVARRAHREADHFGHGRSRRDPGDGGAPLLRAPVDRGQPDDRGLHAQRRQGAVAETLEKRLQLLPAAEERRTSQAAYTSGGEQQMCAIGRALMARPKMVLLDEPSMGLAPQIVEEMFEIVRTSTNGEGELPDGRADTNMALRYVDYGYILENGRVVMDGEGKSLRENEDVKEFYLGMGGGDRRSFKDIKSYRRRKRWLS